MPSSIKRRPRLAYERACEVGSGVEDIRCVSNSLTRWICNAARQSMFHRLWSKINCNTVRKGRSALLLDRCFQDTIYHCEAHYGIETQQDYVKSYVTSFSPGPKLAFRNESLDLFELRAIIFFKRYLFVRVAY